MLFAEGVPDATTIGSVMQTVLYLSCSVSAIALAVAAVWALIIKMHSVPHDSGFVTRAEMSREIGSLRTEISRDMANMRVVLNRDSARVEEQIKELSTYVRQRSHDQSNRQHAFNLRMHYMLNIITQLARKSDIPVGPEPTISREDEA